jgi:hypothetical protein
MGMISLFITLANILLIWVSSMLMFRMKEVLPINKKVFWDDLGVARKVYQKRALIQRSHVLEERSAISERPKVASQSLAIGDIAESPKDESSHGDEFS